MKEINQLFLLLGIRDSIEKKIENEAAKKAQESLKEEAESKLDQINKFDEYKKKIYKDGEEE